ncbi:MAG: toll/interleukin-1 receptor domain-containing protein [Saprospiraceae bacterium]|nr:toll/interleukin-1 receptor domain-containing protein [Saprospiraceae bacterium]
MIESKIDKTPESLLVSTNFATWDNVIFLAHATEDKGKVRELYQILKENNLNPWLDEVNLNPGEKWEDSIKEAIKKSQIFLRCFFCK